MSFKEWLPITRRNRVAMGFALAGLVMFVIWNCLPHYDWGFGTSPVPDGIVAINFWPGVISPDLYVMVVKRPNIDGFLAVAACMALIQSALITLALIPFWKILHASAYVRVPLAVVNLVGGALIVWHLIEIASNKTPPYWITMMTLIATGMFAVSAAFFVFKNELALREERAFPEQGGEP